MEQSFDEAVAQYSEFLRKCGCPEKIIWAGPKDVLFTRSPRIYIRTLTPQGNVAAARKDYEAGLASKLGVEFHMLCTLNEASCCYAWFPRNLQEAQRMMLPAEGGLKMSALVDLSLGKSKGVRNYVVWQVLKIRHGRNGTLYGYPFGETTGLVAKVQP